MISVCLNTPHTFSYFPALHYIVFITDGVVTVIFLIEAVVKIVANGLITVSLYLSLTNIVNYSRCFYCRKKLTEFVRTKNGNTP